MTCLDVGNIHTWACICQDTQSCPRVTVSCYVWSGEQNGCITSPQSTSLQSVFFAHTASNYSYGDNACFAISVHTSRDTLCSREIQGSYQVLLKKEKSCLKRTVGSAVRHTTSITVVPTTSYCQITLPTACHTTVTTH